MEVFCNIAPEFVRVLDRGPGQMASVGGKDFVFNSARVYIKHIT